MKSIRIAALVAVSSIALAPAAMAAKYIVNTGGSGFPADFDARVISAGGVVEKTFPFGVAIVSGPDAGLGAIAGATAVRDRGYMLDRGTMIAADDLPPEFAGPPNSGEDDGRFNLQWGHNYVGAVESWNNGFRGQGVRVAVLDTGFDLDHVDLAPNIDFAASADMTGEGLSYHLPDSFSHGSHTAGTIAAADNGFGTIGVAPEATLVLVKVLGDAGTGSFEDIIEGIYYAANQNVQVMSMSLGAVIPRGDDPTTPETETSLEVTKLANAVRAAMDYAEKQGVTVIVSAGNAGADLNGDGNNVRFQTGLGSNLGIAASTAVGYYANGGANVGQALVPASYTNYGTSMVDFAAPGGDTLYPGNENCTVAGGGVSLPITRPCWVFDLIFSTGSNLNPALSSYFWSGGTSMAAPHAAGVAALIISETGDSRPAQVAREMRSRALEGGAPGRDGFFGHGQANTGN